MRTMLVNMEKAVTIYTASNVLIAKGMFYILSTALFNDNIWRNVASFSTHQTRQVSHLYLENSLDSSSSFYNPKNGNVVFV